MILRILFSSALALVSANAFASIAGTWQGPCEVRGDLSVKFTYVISEPDAEGNGTLAKTKIYYNDAACSVYGHTGRASVAYKLGEVSDDGVQNFDVLHRGTALFDIVKLSEDGNVLSFGAGYSRQESARPTVLSTTDRVFVRVQ